MRFILIALALFPTSALAVECPVPGQPCKILYLSIPEEQMLTQDRGILATAAEGRKVDLDAVALYFRNKIQSAPMGEVKPVEGEKK